MRKIKYSPLAKEHIAYFKKIGDKQIQNKINQLIEAIQLDPFEGIGKPEALKHKLSGTWSRRINTKHRIVYEYIESEDTILISSLKGHY